MNKYVFLTLLLFNFQAILGQKNISMRNPRCIYKTGYSFQFLGPAPYLSFSTNHFLNEKINIEAGVGLIGAFGGVHFFAGKKEAKSLLAPYTGINLGYMTLPIIEVGIGGSSGGWGKFMTFYIPVGVQLMNRNGFQLSVEGAMLAFTGYNSKVIPWGSLKIGKNY